MSIEVTVLVGLVTGVGGFLISYLSHRRAQNKDATEAGKGDGIILTQLGYITSSLDDIKAEQKSLNIQYVEVIKKQAMMERDIKTVFTHVDNLREDMRGYHQNGGKT